MTQIDDFLKMLGDAGIPLAYDGRTREIYVTLRNQDATCKFVFSGEESKLIRVDLYSDYVVKKR
jgi:hypothetical protein